MARTLTFPDQNQQPDFTRGSIFFIGTATVIIRYAGFTILTDPNFLHMGDHVHLGYGLTSKRLTEPAISFEQLPPFDFVLLSHLHGDHFDHLVSKHLDRATPIVSTKHAAAVLRTRGFRSTVALDTWDSLDVQRGPATMRVTAMPGKHAPGVMRPLIPPVMGSMLEFNGPSGRTAFRMYITGDTLIHEHLKEIPQRYSDIDLALLHLGGTRIGGVLLTMDAAQGVEMIRIVNPRKAIPIHYDDYPVFKSPLSDFAEAVRAAGLEERVHYLDRGETFDIEVPAARL